MYAKRFGLLWLLLISFALPAFAATPQTITLKVDGVQREALVFIPTNSPQDKHAVVLAFHGHGGNMHSFAKTAEIETHWPQAFVVYPQGLPTSSKLDREGRLPGWQHLAGDDGDRDLKFVDALLAKLRSDHHVDDQRVFATGFSNGAMFALLLWAQRADTFAGFAIVAGALDPSLHLTASKPVLQIAGEKDALIPLPKVEATIVQERQADAAEGAGRECGSGCTLYQGGKANVKVLVHAGGHVYPPEASELAAEFFRTLAGAATTVTPSPGASVDHTPGPKADIIQYKSRGQDLVAFVYKPPGNGPFPVYMWNHGAERDPMPGALLAKFWVPHGFILFAPLRAGHGPNKGSWIVDEQKMIREQRSPTGFAKLAALHEQANEDVIAAYNWVARQPYVDAKRIVVAGGSYGGIQALLAAERDKADVLGIKCVIAMGPGAESWGNPHWGQRLVTAVNNSRAPIFLMQAHNDYNLGPSELLGPRVDAKGGANRHKLFPDHGDPNDHAQGHAAFFSDSGAWGDDVLAFLHDCGAR
jgi:polyhydroxybutyrate depolymerase